MQFAVLTPEMWLSGSLVGGGEKGEEGATMLLDRPSFYPEGDGDDDGILASFALSLRPGATDEVLRQSSAGSMTTGEHFC